MRLPAPAKPWLRAMAQPAAIVASALVLLTVLLRLPSYFEPYWYGDEGIYLTIGQAINRGSVLYKDIVDHKTPLIYYLAALGSTQLGFRLILTLAMATAAVAFFYVTLRLTRRLTLTSVVSVLFVFAVSLPALEGNIANGELFVMSAVLAGLAVLAHNDQILGMLTKKRPMLEPISSSGHYVICGLLLGIALLTKVPALFDVLAIFFIGWLALIDRLVTTRFHDSTKAVFAILKSWLIIFAGIASLLVGSIAFFAVQGAGSDYLNYGLLYNFHYASSWTPSSLSPAFLPLFSLSGKTVIMAALLVLLSLGGRWWPRPIRWATGWLVLALFGSILSNRPYPHYFLQVIPPLFVTSAMTIAALRENLTKHKKIGIGGLLAVMLLLCYGVWIGLGFHRYPMIEYYQRLYNYSTGRITQQEYRQSFNYLMTDNYAAARLLHSDPEPSLFIWGTNPMLYALSRKQPVGQFTVAFHITDLHKEADTIESLRAKPPTYIVLMRDEPAPLPGLHALLKEQYIPLSTYEHFVIWKRRATANR